MRILPERQKKTAQVATMKEKEASSTFLLNNQRWAWDFVK